MSYPHDNPAIYQSQHTLYLLPILHPSTDQTSKNQYLDKYNQMILQLIRGYLDLMAVQDGRDYRLFHLVRL